MAYANEIRAPHSGLFNRIAEFFGAALDGLARYKVFRETLSELETLSDRELRDLGLSRMDVRRVAAEAAFAK